MAHQMPLVGPVVEGSLSVYGSSPARPGSRQEYYCAKHHNLKHWQHTVWPMQLTQLCSARPCFKP